MMYNITTGYGSITRRANEDIVILFSSSHRLRELDVPFLYTNQHAYSVETDFYDGSENLEQVDWDLLQRRDFKTADADPGKQLRYQAEVLVHQHVPWEALLGIGCYNKVVQQSLKTMMETRHLETRGRAVPDWYF